MKVLERHEEDLEEYTIHVCEGCGSKLDILKKDCEPEEVTDANFRIPLRKYTCECPVCETEIHISDLDWKFRPKVTVDILEGKRLKDFLEKMKQTRNSNQNTEVEKPKEPHTFTVSPELDKWVDDHYNAGCRSHATAGEHFQYEFLPTGIVECQTVKCLVCGKEKTVYVD